jgi:hypothetical protein
MPQLKAEKVRVVLSEALISEARINLGDTISPRSPRGPRGPGDAETQMFAKME